MSLPLPRTADEITVELLNNIVGEMNPGTRIVSLKMVEKLDFGAVNVSLSVRATFDVEFAPGAPRNFATRLVIKMSIPDNVWQAKLFPLYEDEINFYKYVRPGLDLEVPVALGARYDPDSKRFMVIMEDLGLRGAKFAMQSDAPNVGHTQAVLDTLAKLHATFWESPRFKTNLSYLPTHVDGPMEDLMHTTVRQGLQGELSKVVVKRELLGHLGMTEDEMFQATEAVKLHQSTLPQTLVHGDTHFGNTYYLPDGKRGLADWQICVRGYMMHDVAYLINTSLSIELRRLHERELLAYYRDRLGHYGVANPPSPETLWDEFRLGTLWTFYYGWLPASSSSYGWELMTVALLRTSAAFEDHETRKLIKRLT
ncbi:MAG: ecdysteroid 22-kinase family protein [Rhodocyclaceae bacterium]|nr:ecdysteroid 22-kinase family protein [Rhodocyclaceae bacterium]